MKRKDFLKSVGLAGVGLSIPAANVISKNNSDISDIKDINACTLIPTETSGPFPLDLSSNEFYFRQDVRETSTGVQLNLKLKIIGLNNCFPMANVRVNIWHCDKDGNYSGYGTAVGQTFLRGYQITDQKGEVDFITVFPGWYQGRTCHIHFQVYVSSNYAAISQLTFNHEATNQVYADNSTLYTKGSDPKSPDTDNIFSDGYTYQLASLTANANGGYDSYLEVTVKGDGTVGLGNLEKETAKQVILQQNHPNPFNNETTIPFELMLPAKVQLTLWDISGKQVATINKGMLPAGNHQINLNLKTMGLSNANYAYQLEVENSNGIFKDCKMMTVSK